MKTLLYYCFVIIIVLTSLLVGLTNHPLPGGRRLLSLESTSMASVLPPGALILIQNEPWYQPDDIITFWTKVDDKAVLVTHRVVAIGGNVYITKGDNNTSLDRELTPERLIEGRLIFYGPFLGRLVYFLQSKPGLGLLMVPITLILYKEFSEMYYEVFKKKSSSTKS